MNTSKEAVRLDPVGTLTWCRNNNARINGRCSAALEPEFAEWAYTTIEALAAVVQSQAAALERVRMCFDNFRPDPEPFIRPIVPNQLVYLIDSTAKYSGVADWWVNHDPASPASSEDRP